MQIKKKQEHYETNRSGKARSRETANQLAYCKYYITSHHTRNRMCDQKVLLCVKATAFLRKHFVLCLVFSFFFFCCCFSPLHDAVFLFCSKLDLNCFCAFVSAHVHNYRHCGRFILIYILCMAWQYSIKRE